MSQRRNYHHYTNVASDDQVFQMPLENIINIVEPDEKSWEEYDRKYLLEDIKQNGIKVPIWVDYAYERSLVHQRIPDMYIAKNGQHRISCAKKLGLLTVPAVRYPMKSSQRVQEAKDFQDEIVMIPIEKLHCTENWLKTHSFESIYRKAFLADIKENGIRHPIFVQWVSKQEYFKVIDGNHRYCAALLAGLKEIPCRVFDYKNNNRNYRILEVMGKEKEDRGFLRGKTI